MLQKKLDTTQDALYTAQAERTMETDMHAHQLYDLQESMRAMSASKAEKMVNAGVANTDASAVTTALEHTRREAAELRLRISNEERSRLAAEKEVKTARDALQRMEVGMKRMSLEFEEQRSKERSEERSERDEAVKAAERNSPRMTPATTLDGGETLNDALAEQRLRLMSEHNENLILERQELEIKLQHVTKRMKKENDLELDRVQNLLGEERRRGKVQVATAKEEARVAQERAREMETEMEKHSLASSSSSSNESETLTLMKAAAEEERSKYLLDMERKTSEAKVLMRTQEELMERMERIKSERDVAIEGKDTLEAAMEKVREMQVKKIATLLKEKKDLEETVKETVKEIGKEKERVEEREKKREMEREMEMKTIKEEHELVKNSAAIKYENEKKQREEEIFKEKKIIMEEHEILLQQIQEENLKTKELLKKNEIEIASLSTSLKLITNEIIEAKERCTEEIKKRKDLEVEVRELKGSVLVCARVRPRLKFEILDSSSTSDGSTSGDGSRRISPKNDSSSTSCSSLEEEDGKGSDVVTMFRDEGEVLVTQRGGNGIARFEFDEVFSPFSKQKDVCRVAEGVVPGLLRGQCIAVLAYGQTVRMLFFCSCFFFLSPPLHNRIHLFFSLSPSLSHAFLFFFSSSFSFTGEWQDIHYGRTKIGRKNNEWRES